MAEDVTEYVPPAAVVTPAIVGFCAVEVYPAGPFHEYVVPELVADKLNVFPEQIGLGVAVTVGVEGIGFTVTVVVVALEHPLVVPVNV